MTPLDRSKDLYLSQKVLGATSEELVVLALEGCQRFMIQAQTAIARKDYGEKARLLNKVLCLVDELTVLLDREKGGALAENLGRIYGWWQEEILRISIELDAPAIDRIVAQMGELRQAWAEAASRQPATTTRAHEAQFSTEGLVG